VMLAEMSYSDHTRSQRCHRASDPPL